MLKGGGKRGEIEQGAGRMSKEQGAGGPPSVNLRRTGMEQGEKPTLIKNPNAKLSRVVNIGHLKKREERARGMEHGVSLRPEDPGLQLMRQGKALKSLFKKK